MQKPAQGPPFSARHGSFGSRLASALRELASRQASVDATLQAAVDLCVELIEGCDVADIMFLQAKQTTVPVATGAKARALAQAQQAGGGPCIAAASGTDRVIANDLRDDRRWPDFAQQAIELGFNSVMAYPLFLHRDDDDRFGALNLYGSEPGAFDDRDIEIGEVFAAHCAATLAAAIAQEGAQAALQRRDLIGQAKGILMERHLLSANEAFERLIKASQDHNVKLRQIAEVVTFTGQLPGTATPEVQPSAGSQERGPVLNTSPADLLDHLQHLDRQAATDLIHSALDHGQSASSVITELLAPAQRLVGERWHQGRWTVTQEHAATAIIDDLLGLLAERTPPPSRGRIALVCAEGEWHVTPARMAALIWRSAGWDVTYLGGSTPPDHLRTSLELLRPDVVALSCTLPLALPGAGRVAAALDHLGIPILAGGRAYGPDRHRSDALGIHGWAPDALQATTVLERWLGNPPTKPVPFSSDGEELSLELAIPDLIPAAEHKLTLQFPQMQSYDLQQRNRTREDLDYILRFAAVTLQVDDPRIFHDFLEWHSQLLTARHVPSAALFGGLEALTDTITGLPRTTQLLSNAVGQLRCGTSNTTRTP